MRSRSSSLKPEREAGFYQAVWEALEEYLGELGDQLVGEHGFVLDSADLLLSLSLTTRTTDTDLQVHIVRLPHNVLDILPSSPFAQTSRDMETLLIPHHPLHFTAASLAIPPLADVIRLIQCLFPGRLRAACSEPLAQDEATTSTRMGYPPDCWLKKHESLIREVMGCTYYRYLAAMAYE